VGTGHWWIDDLAVNRGEDFMIRILCGLLHRTLTVSDNIVLLVGERYTWKGMRGSCRGLLKILYQYVQGIEENHENSLLG
jgi:hypothetical protein